MDSRKIYCYHTLTPIDIFDSIEWAREHFEFYDGETSPLWNEYVQREFARLNKERKELLEKPYAEYEIEMELDDFIEESD
jgi:hypothetical protein